MCAVFGNVVKVIVNALYLFGRLVQVLETFMSEVGAILQVMDRRHIQFIFSRGADRVSG
jgi:hypothetical protein